MSIAAAAFRVLAYFVMLMHYLLVVVNYPMHILTADSLVQNIASFLCLPPRAVALINWWTIFARYLARLVSIMTLDERLCRAARL